MNNQIAENKAKTLEDIQVGDWIRIRKTRRDAEITQVTRVTPRQFMTDRYSFWKKDGRSPQSFGYDGSRHHARFATPEEIKEHEEAQEREKLALDLVNFLRHTENP